MSTFVTVGNAKQPFTRLLDLVREELDALPQPVFVQHGAAPFLSEACEYAPRVPAAVYRQRMTEAELVICHSGAGCLLDAVALGKTVVTLPRLSRHAEMVDDHQVELATVFAHRNLVAVVGEGETLTKAWARARGLPKPSVRKASPLIATVCDAVDREAALLGAKVR